MREKTQTMILNVTLSSASGGSSILTMAFVDNYSIDAYLDLNMSQESEGNSRPARREPYLCLTLGEGPMVERGIDMSNRIRNRTTAFLVLAILIAGQVDPGEKAASPQFEEVAHLFPMVDLVEDDARFGSSVSMDGDTMVVGAPEENALGTASGAAYVFVKIDDAWYIQAKILASDGAGGDRFGSSVAVEGDTLVVGAYWADAPGYQSGAAYVFRRTGSLWTEEAKITASDGVAGDDFGVSVAVDGATVVVGANQEGELGAAAGAAYVFVNPGGGWTEQQKLTAGDGGASDQFGTSVAVDGETVLVGAHTHSAHGSFAGAAYVFTRSAGVWSEQQELLPTGLQPDDRFGFSVALEGDTSVVGAIYDGAGAAYVFVRSGVTWSQQQRLSDRDGVVGDQFGRSVDISSDTVVVGAIFDDHLGGAGGGIDAGSAFVFTRSGTVWTQQQMLGPGESVGGDWFGYSVAVSGDNLVAGVPYADPYVLVSDTGSAIAYERRSGVWTTLNTVRALEPPDAYFWFPMSVSMSDDVVVVGATAEEVQGLSSAGAAYVFLRSGTTWCQQARLTEPVPGGGAWFGWSVAIEGDTIVVGAQNDEHPGGIAAGTAFVFVWSGSSWELQDSLTASDAGDEDNFGASVAISGDTIIVGSDYQGIDHLGAAYVFVRSGTVWSQQAKLVASDGADTDGFGKSVRISGDTVLVGANLDDHSGLVQAGSAYVFVRSGTLWSEVDKLTAPDAAAGDFFGESLAMDSGTALVGAFGADPTGVSFAGKAYIYRKVGEFWSHQQTLVAPDPSEEDYFGFGVALDGDALAIGAPGWEASGSTSEGSTYIFGRSGVTWSLDQHLVAEDSQEWAEFGRGVAIRDGTVVVTAPETSFPPGIDVGSIYVFESGVVFSDGFESGDTSAWSTAVP